MINVRRTLNHNYHCKPPYERNSDFTGISAKRSQFHCVKQSPLVIPLVQSKNSIELRNRNFIVLRNRRLAYRLARPRILLRQTIAILLRKTIATLLRKTLATLLRK